MGSAADSVPVAKIEAEVYARRPTMGKRFLHFAEERGREHDLGIKGLRDKSGHEDERWLWSALRVS
jgi:hypothetical protein